MSGLLVSQTLRYAVECKYLKLTKGQGIYICTRGVKAGERGTGEVDTVSGPTRVRLWFHKSSAKTEVSA